MPQKPGAAVAPDPADPAVWERVKSANDPQGGPLTAEEERILRQLCVDIPAADLATVEAFKVKKFVRSHGLTNHKSEEKRYEATLKSLREHIEWRRSVRLDDYLRPETEVGARVLKNLRRWRELWGSEIYGVTQAGVPVMYHHMGGLKPDKILEEYPGDSVEDGLILDLELCEKLNQELSRQQGRTINLGVAVIDLRDIGMDLMAPRLLSKIKMMIDLPSNHYPESLTHMYLVNAPMAFRAFWRLVLPFIPEENKRKISLLGTDPKALKQVFRREGIDTRRFPQEVGGEVPADNTPALGWLGAAYQRAVSTGQYVSEGVDLESPTDKRCLDPMDAEQGTADGEQPSAPITQAPITQTPAERPSAPAHEQTIRLSSERELIASTMRRHEQRREQQRARPRGQNGRQAQPERPKRSEHGSTHPRRTPSSVAAAQSSRVRVKQGGRRFSCCAAAPQEVPRAERRARRSVGVIAAARAPEPSDLPRATVASTRGTHGHNKLPVTGSDARSADGPQLPTGLAPGARVQRRADRSTPPTSADGFATWCMSVTGTDAPILDRPRLSPNAGAGADVAGIGRAENRSELTSDQGTVADYWSSVQSSLHGVLSSSGSYEKYSKYWCVDPGMAGADPDLTSSEDSHDGSGGDSPPYCTARKSLPTPPNADSVSARTT